MPSKPTNGSTFYAPSQKSTHLVLNWVPRDLAVQEMRFAERLSELLIGYYLFITRCAIGYSVLIIGTVFAS